MGKPELPSSATGSLTPFMSRNRLREQFDLVDEMLGGVERLYHEANKDSEAYWNFKKLQMKNQPREIISEHTLSTGMEALIKRVEAREKAAMIEGTYTVVEESHAPDAQPD